jgi:TPR repeat protein
MKANRLIWAVLWLAPALQLLGQPHTNAPQEHFEAIRDRVQKGDPEAMLLLAARYTDGDGVPRDLIKAARLHRKAAELGLAQAQCLVGVDYANGAGVKMDRDEAVRWFRRAADQGSAGAQYNLALCYASGAVGGKTPADAMPLYRKAADQGLPAAQFALGEAYFNGLGVPKDTTEGIQWIRRGAEQGNANAQSMLGLCYTKGKGVKQDYVEAYKWLNLAAAQDDQNTLDIKINLSAAERFMTPEQIAEGQRRAREFKPHKGPPPSEAVSPAAGTNSLPAAAVQPGLRENPPTAAKPSRTGLVNIKAEDESQEIFIDGGFVGNTPAKLKLAEGLHLVEVRKAGFKDYRKEVKVEEGSELTLRVVLEKQ